MASDSSERALLALCLRRPEAVDDALSHGLRAGYFGNGKNRLLWKGFVEDRARGAGPDEATLYDRHETYVGRGRIFDSWADFNDFVKRLLSTPCSHHNLPGYVERIAESARRRQIVNAAQSLIAMEQGSYSMEAMLEEASKITSASCWAPEGSSDPLLAYDIVEDYFDEIEAQRRGERATTLVLTGIDALDGILRVRPGQMVVIGGRPKQGKTHLTISVLKNIAKTYTKPALMISAEMGRVQLGERMATSGARVGTTLGQAQSARGQVLPQWEGVPLYFDHKPKSINSAITSIRTAKRKLGICVAAVDYLQLLKMGADSSRERQVAEASSSLKRLAMELDIPIFVVAQLNRKADYRDNKRPLLSDLRDSGQIEQDADAVAFVYRPVAYDDEYEPKSDVEVIVRAQRNGPTGTARCHWEPGEGWFEDVRD